MFDIGFWELVIISTVALLVVGPEKLPGLIRQLSRWFAAIRRFVLQTKTELERDLDFDMEKDFSTKISDLDDLAEIAPDRQERDKATPPPDK